MITLSTCSTCNTHYCRFHELVSTNDHYRPIGLTFAQTAMTRNYQVCITELLPLCSLVRAYRNIIGARVTRSVRTRPIRIGSTRDQRGPAREWLNAQVWKQRTIARRRLMLVSRLYYFPPTLQSPLHSPSPTLVLLSLLQCFVCGASYYTNIVNRFQDTAESLIGTTIDSGPKLIIA